MQPEYSPPATKRCTRCGAEKPLAQFVKDKREPDGHGGCCVACQRARVAELKAAREAAGVGPPTSKRCGVCGETKPGRAFYHSSYTPDGVEYLCKACKRASVRRSRQVHREEIEARRRADVAANPEKYRAWDKARRLRDPEHMRLRRSAERARNAARYRQRAAEWYKSNTKRALRNSYNAMSRRRARLKQAPLVEMVDRETIYDRDKGICQICGLPIERKDLELDHIVPLFQGGSHTAANLRCTHRWCNRRRKRTNYAEQLPLVV